MIIRLMDQHLDRGRGGWRGIVLAAILCGLAALPGLIRLPVIDRGEASFAEGTAQMIEQDDYTAIRYQQRLRGGTAPGAHWAQAASVAAISRAEDRKIWAWRLPSLLGLMLAAAATAWGAGELFGRRCALPSGLICGGSLLISTLGAMATSDALFAGTSAVALSAFAKLYIGRGGRWTKLALWAGLIGAALVEGPTAIGVAILAAGVLIIADRRAGWIKGLGWGWGLLAFAAAVLPWIVAVTVATDGDFWTPDAAAKAGHLWPGAQTLALPILLFPATALLPAAAAFAWRHRAEPAVRAALAWIIPSAILLELAPDRQIVDQAPLFAAIAWLCAAALFEAHTPVVRRIGAALAMGAGLLLAALCLWLTDRFGVGSAGVIAGVTAVLFAAAGGVSGLALLRGWGRKPWIAAFALGVAAHLLLVAGLAPALTPLWPARSIMRALANHSLDPRQGIAIGPVASAGFAEPSLVFALGPETETGVAADAVQAISEGRPAIVEQDQDAAFRTGLTRARLSAQAVQAVDGYDYVEGRTVRLSIYRATRSATRTTP
jgi:4-amino-4-deoxy-L-arabinose transferase-like glycosyltransferase